MTAPPTLSIIVATGAPAGDRGACMAALAAQRFPEGGGEIIEVPMRGDAGAAWNAGAARAKGQLLLFLRDDVLPYPTLAAEHVEAWRRHPHDVMTGPVDVDPAAKGIARYYGEQVGAESAWAQCCGRPLALSRHLLGDGGKLADGFRQGLAWGAEAELAFRSAQRGSALVRLPRAVGVRRMPQTVDGIGALLAAEGCGSVALYRRHPALLPSLKLGAFSSAGEGALLARRAMLALPAPAARLARLVMHAASRKQDAWHRFLCSYFYWRGVRGALDDRDLWRRLTRGPVILMYHAVGHGGERAGCYIVPVRRFRRQMRWLKLAGYRVLSMDELLRHRGAHSLPPARAVVITFDDGYRDNWTLATPVLRALGFTATFFLVTDRMGATNQWDRDGELAGRPLLSWDDVRQMVDSGMDVGGHTRSHPVLPSLAPDDAAREVDGARCDIARQLGHAPRAFAYPFGRFDASTTEAVGAAGYDAACCSRSGVNDPAVPSFQLRRLEVRGTDSLWQFALGVRRGRARRTRRRR